MIYRDRFDAGRQLAERLLHYRDQPEVLVLGLPRGGVPIAFELAHKLHAPLDVFLVRKLGVPGHEELAMGAIASGDVLILNDDVVNALHISQATIQRAAERERRELRRQETVYRANSAQPAIEGRTIILVDDGLATGSTMRAAVLAIRRQEPARIVVAVPVGAAQTCAEFAAEADETICAVAPEHFFAVAMWYEDFSPTDDATVQRLLQEADERMHATN
jgi:putative phosphoribosyl transferase